jgi:hypothetical protein
MASVTQSACAPFKHLRNHSWKSDDARDNTNSGNYTHYIGYGFEEAIYNCARDKGRRFLKKLHQIGQWMGQVGCIG